MRRYPEYKENGIEWLGEIPANWEVTTLKRVCDKITDGSHFSPPTQDEGFPYITVQDVRENGIGNVPKIVGIKWEAKPLK